MLGGPCWRARSRRSTTTRPRRAGSSPAASSGLALILARVGGGRRPGGRVGHGAERRRSRVARAVRRARPPGPRRRGATGRAAPGRRSRRGRRCGCSANGVALPLALQAIYVICLPLASREGEGAVTSFGYAYLLTVGGRRGHRLEPGARHRRAVDAHRARRRVGPPATSSRPPGSGSVAVRIRRRRARARRRDDRGGPARLELAGGRRCGDRAGSSPSSPPWAVASVGIAVTFPLLFVHGRGWWLPLLAAAWIALQFPLAWLGQTSCSAWTGSRFSLALTTGLILGVMLASLGSASSRWRRGSSWRSASDRRRRRRLRSSVPFGVARARPRRGRSARRLFVGILGATRPAPLREAWRYLRALT